MPIGFTDQMFSCQACTGVFSGPALGNWTRGWLYGWDILNTLKHWSVGWIDWNLCLDQRGGPNWINNYVDSPVGEQRKGRMNAE
jgi:glucosylceramidase